MMMFFVLVLFAAHESAAQNCSSGSTCMNCASQPGCGWCAASRTCLPGTPQGPQPGFFCEPAGKLWSFGTCPTCDSFSGDCRACTLGNGDCAWCAESNRCVAYDDASCGAKLQSCPCANYQSCSTCTLLSNTACRWCPATAGGACVDESANCTTGTPATSCPCKDNLSCDQCLADFNGNINNGCSWCGAGVGCQDKTAKACPIAALSCPAACAARTAGGCKACQQGDGCAWCAEKSECVDAAKTTCFVAHTCPEDHCAKFQACDTCNERSAMGCRWCVEQTNTSTIMSCKSTLPGAPEPCKGSNNATCSEYCHMQTTCGDCQQNRGCAWCSVNETAKCINYDIVPQAEAHCAVKLACDAPAGGLNATGAFFLGAFAFFIALVVVVGAIKLYQKRKGATYSTIK
jgi:hypothetical protein